ncbi:hypothetical protein CUMW_273580 [Citrus unshiu]|uniref:Ubiquitin-like domain-containing protein n=1 Tax=Citrus unshiu TaxID=55188 RepID=A0A2H5MWH8_CITUN|nr:hypothetical protein CUMW_273580 [Citrus unshiu]
MNGKISQHLQSNSNKRTAHGIRAHHFAPALKLQTMELKLSKFKTSEFVKKDNILICTFVLVDFKPAESVKLFYLGKELEDHKSLADQNVRPNSLIHLIRTKIHLLPRAQKLPGENKSLRPPGAFKKKSDLSVKDGHVFLME